jgi:hypothetical protein
VKNELEATLNVLSGKGKGVKGKGPRGAERRKMWDDVKALRKECGIKQSIISCCLLISSSDTANARGALSGQFWLNLKYAFRPGLPRRLILTSASRSCSRLAILLAESSYETRILTWSLSMKPRKL